MKTKTTPTTNPINGRSLRCGLFLIALMLAVPTATYAGGVMPGVRRPIANAGYGMIWQVPNDNGRDGLSGGMAPASVTISSSTVDTDLYTGYENAIFAPDDNTVYVAYKRFLSDPTTPGYIPAELRIAKSIDAGQTWTIAVVDPDAIEEGDTINNSVSIDGYRGSVVYVAYLVQPSGLFADIKLRVAKSTDGGSTWTTRTVAQGAGGDQNSIRVLNPNTAVISAHANGAAEGIHTFITRDGGTTWSDTLVAGGIGNGYYTSVGAVDSRSIWVGYYNSLYPDHQDMNAGKRLQGGSWDNFLVDDAGDGIAGLGSSITVAPNRAVYAAYEADTSSGAFVRVASKRNGAPWNVVDVQSDITIGWNTAIHEFNGKLYVSYWRVPSGSIGLAMWAVSGDTGLTWTPITIPETRSVTPYIDSTAPSNFTQFESYQTVDPSTFTQPILQVARIGG
ncbi:MAG TPA: sialidase family protein [Chthoniobacterales bacterium]